MGSEKNARHHAVATAYGEALVHGAPHPEGFTILREINRGGMAVVYLAKQLNPVREVALKVMLPRYVDNQEVRACFQIEAQAMATLEHARVMPVYQTGEWNGLSFIAMKLAVGGTLEDYLKKHRPTIKQTVMWLAAVGEAVHFLHRRGVLHRDLKPGNLLFDAKGDIFVGDFGVAHITNARNIASWRVDALVGTPHYLAPEIASRSAQGASVAADNYSLGAVLYECLTGQCPFDGDDDLPSLLKNIAKNELPCVRELRPETPEYLAAVCAKAMAKNPEDRHESVQQFVEDLRRMDQSGIE